MNTFFLPELYVLVDQISRLSPVYQNIQGPNATTGDTSGAGANPPSSGMSLEKKEAPALNTDIQNLHTALQHVYAYCSSRSGVQKLMRTPQGPQELIGLLVGYRGGYPMIAVDALAIAAAVASTKEGGTLILACHPNLIGVLVTMMRTVTEKDSAAHEKVAMFALGTLANLSHLVDAKARPLIVDNENDLRFLMVLVTGVYQNSTVVAEMWCRCIEVFARHSVQLLQTIHAMNVFQVVQDLMELHGHVLANAERGWKCLAALSKINDK